MRGTGIVPTTVTKAVPVLWLPLLSVTVNFTEMGLLAKSAQVKVVRLRL